METKRVSLDVILILLLLALAVFLVDERWLRAGVSIVPALLLLQRAKTAAPVAGAQAEADNTERRADPMIRGYIEELLRQIREFYTTCHLMTGGELGPAAAKDRVTAIERSLNLLLAKVSDAAKA